MRTIKTQDGTTIINIEKISSICVLEKDVFISTKEGRNGTYCICIKDSFVSDTCKIIAEYPTKEQAFKVLNRLNNWLKHPQKVVDEVVGIYIDISDDVTRKEILARKKALISKVQCYQMPAIDDNCDDNCEKAASKDLESVFNETLASYDY